MLEISGGKCLKVKLRTPSSIRISFLYEVVFTIYRNAFSIVTYRMQTKSDKKHEMQNRKIEDEKRWVCYPRNRLHVHQSD